MKFKIGDEIEGKVVDLAFGGEGIIKHEGAVVFVPFAAMDETLHVRITEAKKSFYRGKIVSILEASLNREEPPCPYYSFCGGCQYQHLKYEAELAAKNKQLKDLLARVAKIENPSIQPVIHAEPYGYRNRITVHNEGGRIGFRAMSGRDIVDVKKCLLATDEVNQKLTKLREQRRPRPHYSVRADAVAGEAFYQTNELLMSVLRDTVSNALMPDARAVVEGYCGVGFFTEAMAKKVEQIVSIESDPKAKSHQPHLPNVIWLEGTCEEYMGQAQEKIQQGPVVCFVDPPREGLSEIVRQDLLKLKFDQLLYLSCNPSTLARDIHTLASVWNAVNFQPIDLFPRTAHLECLVTLQPK